MGSEDSSYVGNSLDPAFRICIFHDKLCQSSRVHAAESADLGSSRHLDLIQHDIFDLPVICQEESRALVCLVFIVFLRDLISVFVLLVVHVRPDIVCRIDLQSADHIILPVRSMKGRVFPKLTDGREVCLFRFHPRCIFRFFRSVFEQVRLLDKLRPVNIGRQFINNRGVFRRTVSSSCFFQLRLRVIFHVSHIVEMTGIAERIRRLFSAQTAFFIGSKGRILRITLLLRSLFVKFSLTSD